MVELSGTDGETLRDLRLGKTLYDLTPTAKSVEGKSDKLDIIKTKAFALRKTLLPMWKRQDAARRKYLQTTTRQRSRARREGSL